MKFYIVLILIVLEVGLGRYYSSIEGVKNIRS